MCHVRGASASHSCVLDGELVADEWNFVLVRQLNALSRAHASREFVAIELERSLPLRTRCVARFVSVGIDAVHWVNGERVCIDRAPNVARFMQRARAQPTMRRSR